MPQTVRSAAMVASIREMPAGIRLFLVYALLILAGIGLSLRFVVDQAISAPVSLPGIVVMILLAYTIFTTTLVLQRKQAAYGLAIGLASLTVPLVLLLLVSPVHPALPVLHRRVRAAAVPRAAAARGAALPVRGLTDRRARDRGRAGTLSRRGLRRRRIPHRSGDPFRPHRGITE